MTQTLLRVRMTPKYRGLVISEDGRIQGPSRRWLKPFQGKDGYLRINLYGPGRHWTQVGVHAVVCTAFHGPRPEGLLVRHLDGDPLHNHACNLAWGTYLENEADKLRHGTTLQGSRNHQAKLQDTDVVEIRRALSEGVLGQALALQYDVSETTISSIKLGRTWGHL